MVNCSKGLGFVGVAFSFFLRLISESIEFSSVRNNCLPNLHQIFITLRFLACGSFLEVVGDTVPSVSKATMCRCVRRLCLAITFLIARFIEMQHTDQEKVPVKQIFLRSLTIFSYASRPLLRCRPRAQTSW